MWILISSFLSTSDKGYVRAHSLSDLELNFVERSGRSLRSQTTAGKVRTKIRVSKPGDTGTI